MILSKRNGDWESVHMILLKKNGDKEPLLIYYLGPLLSFGSILIVF